MAVKHLYLRDSGILIVGFLCTEAGDEIPQHVHPHGHFFFCSAGAFVMGDGERIPMLSGKWIPEETPHSAVSAEAGSIGLCFQYLRDLAGAPFGKLADTLPIGEILASEQRLTL